MVLSAKAPCLGAANFLSRLAMLSLRPSGQAAKRLRYQAKDADTLKFFVLTTAIKKAAPSIATKEWLFKAQAQRSAASA